MKNRKQPGLRFSDYSDEWKTQVLRDVVERVTRKNKDLQTQLPLTISAQYGLVDQISYFNKQVASKDMSNYFLLKRGEFAYNKSYSRDYPWGAIKRLEKYDMGALSSLYITFKPLKIDSNFLVSYYDTNKWHKEVSTRATEGARNHGLLNISANDFLETEIVIPLQEEQEKIGSFFKHIDEIIALQQQELETLKQTKQGFLQKMFPKEGETLPEVRFEGFKDEWETIKLSDVKDVRDGTHDSPKYQSEGFPLVTSKNLKEYGLDMTEVSFISKEDYESINKRSKVDVGDILFGMIGTIGNPIIVERNGFAIKNVALIKNGGAVTNEFIIHLLKTHSFLRFIQSENVGNTQKFVGLNKIREYKFHVPISSEEQIKIGKFFRQLDKTIELHEKELEALKQTKKAFLQKMFV